MIKDTLDRLDSYKKMASYLHRRLVDGVPGMLVVSEDNPSRIVLVHCHGLIHKAMISRVVLLCL